VNEQPATPTDQDDPVPPEEQPADEAETGAWMGERDEEPSDSGEPPEA
jgi:hypothetical protein